MWGLLLTVQKPQPGLSRSLGDSGCTHMPPPPLRVWVRGTKCFARQRAEFEGCPSAFPEMGCTPDSATSGASSKLAPAVTHFPLLLFLEVLMSMRNSAERLSEKKEEGEGEERGRERQRRMGKSRECQVKTTVARVPVTTLTVCL